MTVASCPEFAANKPDNRYNFYSTKPAVEVSAVTWALMFIVTFPWVLYGLAHRDKNIIVSFILWEIMNATVVIGALLYR